MQNAPGSQRLQILGSISNFVQQPGASPSEHAHRAGLTFVALDSRVFPAYRGETPTGEWIVSRKILGEFPQLNPWPNTGWRFDAEGPAREAYQAMRAHILAKLPGAQPRDDRTLERRLNDPSTAWSESFSMQGHDALRLACDRTTVARILEMTTDRLGQFPVKKGANEKIASYSTQVSPHVLAVGTGQSGLAEHVLVAFTPANETQLVAGGLAGSDCDTKPFDLDLSSGILVISWGRIDGSNYFTNAQGQDPAAVVANMIGQNLAQPLRTPYDGNAPGPVAWGIRVRPGSYRVALRFLETEQGISAMALSHAEAPPLFADMAAPQGQGQMQAPPQVNLPQAAQAAQAAQAQIAAGQGGDEDPLVFPGQPLARLSDYVRLMKGMQTGDMNGALQRAGLTMASYGQAAQAWGMKMASDPVLTQKFATMMSRP